MNPQLAADQAENRAIAGYRDPVEMEFRREAADLIEKVGWAQGHWRRPTGEICADEALIVVCKVAPLELFDSLVSNLERELGLDLRLFNDTPGRTKEQVLAALRGTK